MGDSKPALRPRGNALRIELPRNENGEVDMEQIRRDNESRRSQGTSTSRMSISGIGNRKGEQQKKTAEKNRNRRRKVNRNKINRNNRNS